MAVSSIAASVTSGAASTTAFSSEALSSLAITASATTASAGASTAAASSVTTSVFTSGATTVPTSDATSSPAMTAAAAAPVASEPVTAIEAKPAPVAPVTTTTPSLSAPAGNSNAYATPLVRKIAAERGVDLSTVVGTGVGGRIRKEDISSAPATLAPVVINETRPVESKPFVPPTVPSPPVASAKAPAQSAPASDLRGRTEPMSRLRKVIAERMVESLQISAQLTSVVEVDVTRIASLRNRSKAAFESREGVKLSFLPFFAKGHVR